MLHWKIYRSVTKVINTSRVLSKCQVSIEKKNSLFLNPKYQRVYSPYRYPYTLVLLTEKISSQIGAAMLFSWLHRGATSENLYSALYKGSRDQKGKGLDFRLVVSSVL